MKEVRLAMVGLGAVGTRVLGHLVEHRARLRSHYGVDMTVRCVADSSGVALSETGFDALALIEHKAAGGRLEGFDGYEKGLTIPRALDTLGCDILLEASPVDLETGEPGLSNSRAALERGLHLVLANKGPLALAYGELAELARASDVGMLHSAAFCGGLPVLNVLRRDMVCGRVHAFRGVLNGTTNFILHELQAGRDFDAALREAQEIGAAEADPRLDIEGWDTAAKLVIAANSFSDAPVTIHDVAVEGIQGVDAELLAECRERGEVLKLLGIAERAGDAWSYRVEPTPLPSGDFLAGCTAWQMAVEIESDLYGTTFHKQYEREPIPTSASMLRDTVHLATGGRAAAL